MEVNLRRGIKDTSFFMWNIMLPTPEDSVKAVKCDFSTKDLILRTDYVGKSRTKVAVFEVLYQVIGEHLDIYLSQYGQILGTTYDKLNGG